jgi:hypothetical protein
MYVVNDEGERVICPHPCESITVERVLGKGLSRRVLDSRTGFESHCVCVDCLHQFEADLGHLPELLEGAGRLKRWHLLSWGGVREDHDERVCPRCGSATVRTARELVDQPCPSCKQGTFVEQSTGLIG